MDLWQILSQALISCYHHQAYICECSVLYVQMWVFRVILLYVQCKNGSLRENIDLSFQFTSQIIGVYFEFSFGYFSDPIWLVRIH